MFFFFGVFCFLVLNEALNQPQLMSGMPVGDNILSEVSLCSN